MYSAAARFCLLSIITLMIFGVGSALATAQSSRTRSTSQPVPRTSPTPPPSPTPVTEAETEGPPAQDVETLKISTDLVTVPVIATDRNGIYAADLHKEDFNLTEDGTKQEIAFYATVSAPFHVVLMLDTSASTQQKLGEIRQAASAFVDQLQPQDRVKIISFDDEVRDLNEFTSDRAKLKAAIQRTSAGQGTKLYDAFSLALTSIRRIEGRKAIVLFTDGVDFHSDLATFDSTLRGLDEEGVIVYPIRYETRAETERIAREQAGEQGPTLPTIGVIRAPTSGTTVPTFPSDDPDAVPTTTATRRTGPLGLPLPDEIMRRRRAEQDRDRDRRNPTSDNWPSPSLPPDPTRPDPSIPGSGGGPTIHQPTDRGGDSIDAMLDGLYLKADSYLKQLETKSGGKLLRADTLGSLPDAFAKIAAELRTQYTLGYYPLNKSRDGKYRKIKVTTVRKDVVVRARPGYISSRSE